MSYNVLMRFILALLASDEDEVDYDSAKYLEALQDRIKKNAPHSPFAITTSIGVSPVPLLPPLCDE